MNLSSLLQFRDEWARFKARHPKFSPFLKAAYTRALREDLAALCDRAGRALVARVQLHSAPTRLAQEDAFKRSLASCIMSTYDTVLLL